MWTKLCAITDAYNSKKKRDLAALKAMGIGDRK